jgi:hypothetical protein
MANATTEIIWIRSLLRNLVSSPLQQLDFGVITLGQHTCQQTVFHARTKHIEIDYHFVRERVAQKLLHVRLIGTNDQVADGFTKAIPIRKLEELRNNLNLEASPS